MKATKQYPKEQSHVFNIHGTSSQKFKDNRHSAKLMDTLSCKMQNNRNSSMYNQPSMKKNVLQGVFNILQIGNALVSQNDINKMNFVIANLQQLHNNILNYEGDVEINIVNGWTTNPATTWIRTIRPTYRIDLELFYIKMSSEGEILSLLTHELGVHSLADVQTGIMPHGINPPGPVIGGSADHQPVAGPILPGMNGLGGFNINIAGIPYNMDTNTAGQVDHINAVDFSAAMTSRANNYLTLFLEIGDNIGGIQLQQHRDLTKTFLFDIARILVTNDGGMFAVGTHPQTIADAMQHVFATVILPRGAAHPWINAALYAQQTGFGIFVYLTRKLFSGINSLLHAHF